MKLRGQSFSQGHHSPFNKQAREGVYNIHKGPGGSKTERFDKSTKMKSLVKDISLARPFHRYNGKKIASKGHVWSFRVKITCTFPFYVVNSL